MAIQNDNTLVTKGDLKALYSDKIAPYLGANLAIRTNVSDYYSTEEKVVGVWIDGKPLYSKTLTGSTSVAGNAWSDTGIVTPSNIILIELLPIRYLDGSQFQIIPCIGYIENNHLQIFNIRNNTYAVSTIYATIYYTKTTDTASSALTAGCYDINFPNTQPNGSEVYFGNGLYGMRKQGTATVGELRPGLVLATGVSTSAVCWSKGGMIDMSKTAGTNQYDINGVWDKSSPYRPLLTNTNGRFRFYCLQCEGYSDDTSLQYNIWFTYTK